MLVSAQSYPLFPLLFPPFHPRFFEVDREIHQLTARTFPPISRTFSTDYQFPVRFISFCVRSPISGNFFINTTHVCSNKQQVTQLTNLSVHFIEKSSPPSLFLLHGVQINNQVIFPDSKDRWTLKKNYYSQPVHLG